MKVRVRAASLAIATKAARLLPKWLRDLHPKQLAFVLDEAKRKAAICGRRAGKSRGVGCWLLEGAEQKPGEKSVYIGLTRGKAKEILWDQCLEPLNREYGLGLRLKHSEGQLYVVHPNGHRVWLLGVDKRSEVDKVRGEKLWRAVIDEAQAFGDHMKELVEEALEWALMDLDGQIALTGTPNASCTGYFWGATTGEDPDIAQWSSHHWTVLDNPGIPHAEEWLRERREKNHWKEDNPTYMREGLGIWIKDINALIYPFDSGLNRWQRDLVDQDRPFGLPLDEWSFGLGVDLGFGENTTAFTLAAVRKGSGKAILLRSYTRSRLIPSALAVHVGQIREEVLKKTGLGLRVVVDEGALGKGYAEQMRAMGVGCEAAQKQHKRTYQEYVRGMLLSGSVLVDYQGCAELVDEARKLQFDPDTGLEDARYPNHCCDAMLYIVRAMLPNYDPELMGPEPGSPEAINLEMRRRKQKLISEREKRNRRRADAEWSIAA